MIRVETLFEALNRLDKIAEELETIRQLLKSACNAEAELEDGVCRDDTILR